MRCLKLLPVVTALALAACGPNESQKQEIAEKKRIECLDMLCDGDVEPKREIAKEVVFKRNGQWYVAPKDYFAAGDGAAGFYWPGRQPLYNAGRSPEIQGKKFYDVAVEIFLTGRQRWPEPQVEKPWERVEGMPPYWRELQSRGMTIKRNPVAPNLERVEFTKADGTRDRTVYYVATEQKRLRGNGPPILSCDVSMPPHPHDRCFGGGYWQNDVLADFRFRATHAADWPAIHQEIVRVLNLAKKAQP
jgi:hypothetical protein